MKVAFVKYLAGLLAAMLLPFTAFAQVPVTDAALNTQTASNQIETIAKWAQQYKQMESQIMQMKQQYEAITGSRNFGEIMNNPALANYLPAEWRDVYGRIQQGGYKGLSGSAQVVLDANRVFNACQRKPQGERAVCERQAALSAQNMANASSGFDQAMKRLDQINQLMGQINGTSDAKGIAELQARIAGEQAAIQNEATKLQLYAMAAQAQERLAEQQQREVNAQHLSRRGYVKPQAVNFNK